MALSAEQNLLEDLRDVLESNFGEVEITTNPARWDYSPKYTEELGQDIKRQFFIFKHVGNPEDLPTWKTLSNKLEKNFYQKENHNDNRKVNLDPGYLSCNNVVLASTKRYGNRIYLRDGIYADLTLFYDHRRRSFCAHKLTFPDYRTRRVIRFFNSLRFKYLAELRPTEKLFSLEQFEFSIHHTSPEGMWTTP